MVVILNYNTIITECLEMAFGLQTYMKILQTVKKEDFKADANFRKMYNGFYKVRQRSSEWYDKYYLLMEQQSIENRSFEDLLRIMYQESGNIEVSFVSKLMATVNPQLPIWDKYVLKNLGKETEWSRLQGVEVKKRIKEASRIYLQIECWYKTFLQSEKGKKCIAKFNEVLPDYKNELTDVKKIDFFLWGKR